MRVILSRVRWCVWVWFGVRLVVWYAGGANVDGNGANANGGRIWTAGGLPLVCVRCRLSACVGGVGEYYLFGVDNIGGLSGAFYTPNGGEFWRTVCVRYTTLPQTHFRPSTSDIQFGRFPNSRGEFEGGFSADLVQTTAATTRKARTVGEITEATSFCSKQSTFTYHRTRLQGGSLW